MHQFEQGLGTNVDRPHTGLMTKAARVLLGTMLGVTASNLPAQALTSVEGTEHQLHLDPELIAKIYPGFTELMPNTMSDTYDPNGVRGMIGMVVDNKNTPTDIVSKSWRPPAENVPPKSVGVSRHVVEGTDCVVLEATLAGDTSTAPIGWRQRIFDSATGVHVTLGAGNLMGNRHANNLEVGLDEGTEPGRMARIAEQVRRGEMAYVELAIRSWFGSKLISRGGQSELSRETIDQRSDDFTQEKITFNGVSVDTRQYTTYAAVAAGKDCPEVFKVEEDAPAMTPQIVKRATTTRKLATKATITKKGVPTTKKKVVAR